MLREKYENELEITFTGSADECFNFILDYKLNFFEYITAYECMGNPYSPKEKRMTVTMYLKIKKNRKRRRK